MAQRKERTLGYEGRYRRTLSPSGLGSNNSSKSSLDSASPGASDTARGPVGSGKLDSTMSPAAWEKFHNIRPPSTTVIFTSNELAKGISSPPSSSSPSTSGSPQPPVQSPFHRSISCDSNIFNNKTGASQSTIPPPIAQVAPLRGSHNDFESEKNRYMITSPAKEKDSCSPEGDNLNGIRRDEKERGFQDSIRFMYERKRCEEQKPEAVARSSSMTFSNSVLPSVIVPPLQYEKYERESRSPGLTLNPNYSSESNLSILKKSEVSLRVNCNSVIDLQSEINELGADLRSKGPSPCPSSTDSCADAGMIGKGGVTLVGNNSAASFYTGRQKTQEELECEELSRDIAKLLPQGDKLQTLLVPLPDHKTTADYMEGLFHLELKLQPETPERRGSISNQDGQGLADELPKSATTQEETNTPQKTVSPDLEEFKGKDELPRANGDISQEDHFKRSERTHSSCSPQPEVAASTGEMEGNEKRGNNVIQSYRRCNGHAPLPADSAYFTTSECKAKFFTQYNNDIKKDPISGTDSEELDKQKEELVSRISKKLEILRTEQLVLREEIQSNEQLGHMVVERVKQTAKRNEFDKFKLHVEEIEKITSLLLGISGRLARAENALMGLSDPPNPQEKKILESKRDKLREQLDEAKILKENIDRRSAQVSSFLQKYLTVEEYADYDHFVKMKAKLIIDAREIDDKIKLGEEQLGALKDALNTMPFIPNTSP